MKKHIALLLTAATMLFMFSACSDAQISQITDKTDLQDESSVTADLSFSESKNENVYVTDEEVLEENSSEPILEATNQETLTENKKEEPTTITTDTTSKTTTTPTQKPVVTPESTPKPIETPNPTPEPTLVPTPTPVPTPEPTPQPTPTPSFDVNYWVEFAKSYGQSLGMSLDSSSIGSWDTPIGASAKSIYLERDIKDTLDWYKNDFGYTGFYVWAEQIGDGRYNIYISYC